MKHAFITMILGAQLATGQATFSERLATIGSYLGEGGAHYSVTDHEGDLENGAQVLTQLMSLADEEVLQKINFEKLGKELGLYAILGSGQSSSQIENYWHNRDFILTNGTHDGLLSLLGANASSPISYTFAPEGADIIFESEIDLQQLEQTATQCAATFGPEAVGSVREAFEKNISEEKTAANLLKDFTVRLAVVAWFDEAKKVELMPGLELPAPHLVARIDRAKDLWEILAPELKEESEVVEKDGEITYFSDAEETPFGPMRAQLTWVEKDNQLWFSLFSESLEIARGKGKKITTDSHFIAATKGLPKETNLNGYLSARAIELILQGANLGKAMNPEAAPFIEFLTSLGAQANSPHGYAQALKIQKDGILSVANSAFPNKGTSLGGPQSVAAISVLAGLATPAILKAKQNAKKAEEISKMRQLMIGLIDYDQEWGAYPDKLSKLEDTGSLDKGMLDALAAPGLVYRGKEVGSMTSAKSTDILLYLEMPKTGKVIFGKVDGSVGEARPERFKELLKAQKN